VSTDIAPTMIATECPDLTCLWTTFAADAREVVFGHLVEKHGYVDTTAHVMAHEAVTPAEPGAKTDHTCKHCGAPLAIYDDPYVWEDVHGAIDGGSGSLCPSGPNGEHRPETIEAQW
jgi:hypothetical protein